MGLPSDLPIVDHHCHLSEAGDGVDAVRRFRHAGGTHLFLATQQYGDRAPATLEEYADQFERTDALARRAEETTGVVVYRVVAPYPLDLLDAARDTSPAEAVRLQEAALDLAGRWVNDQRAVALGEIGRPHFPVPPELSDAIDSVLVHALEVARDADCPAIVHSEDLGEVGFRGLAELAARVGFPVRHLVKHYARSVVGAEKRCGISPSYLANRELVAASLAEPGPWFWETDYLDDPARPGAVLDLATIPRRAAAVALRDPATAESLRIPFETSIREVYGFTPVVENPRGL